MELGNLQVAFGADISNFERGMAQVQADLGKVAQSATAAAGPVEKSAQRITDSQGRVRDGFGKFVNSAQLAAEAAGKFGGSLGGLSDVTGKAATSINGGLAAGFAAFDAKLKPLNEGVGRLGEGLKGLGGGLTASVTLPLGLLGGAALKMAGDLEVAKVSFTTMLGSAAAATETLNELKQFAADTPFEFPEIQDAAKKLLAFNTPAKELKETLRQLGDISAGIGAPIGEIADLFGKARVQGRLFQEDINQLTGRGIPIIQELAKQFNVTEDGVRKLVESGKVNFSNLQTAFADLTKEGGKFGGLMQAQSETIPGLFSTLSDNAGQALASLGQEIAKSLNLKGIITDLSAFVQSAAEAFRNLSPGAKDFAIAAGVVAASLGPIAFALGSVLTLLPQLEAGLAVLGLEAGAALGPILPIAAAVAAAIYLIYENFDAIKGFLQSGEVAALFSELGTAASSAVESIGAAFATLRANVGGNLGDLVSAGQVFSTLFREIAVGITAAFDVVGGAVKAINSAVTGDFSSALDGARQAAQGLIAPIANLFGFGQRPATDSGVYVLSQHAKEFNAVGPQLAANLALLNNVQLGEVATKAKDAAAAVGLLADLQARLKTAQDAKPNLTTEAEITASNKLIANLELQIKRLNELGIGSKKAQDAFAKLNAELANLGKLDGLLGDTPTQLEVLERRIATLSAGLKNLVTAGVSTASKGFQDFVAQTVRAQQALDGLQSSTELKLNVLTQVKLNPATLGEQYPALQATLSKELLDRPLLVPLKIQPPQLADTFSTLQDLSKALAEAGVSSATFGTSFDFVGARADALKAALQRMITEGVSPLSPAFQGVKAEYDEAIATQERLRLSSELLTSGLAAIGEALGSSLASGADAFKSILNALLGALGDFAIQYGKAVLLKGAADIALGNVGQGLLELAGGTALIAGGAALKGLAGGGGASGGGGGAPSGGGGISAPRSNFNAAPSPKEADQVTIKHEVVMVQRGSDLVNTLQIATTRGGRVVPTKRP